MATRLTSLFGLLCIMALLDSGALADPRRRGEPYDLLGPRLVFTDWTYVRMGDVGWKDTSGTSVFTSEDMDPKLDPFAAQWAPGDHLPWGIELHAQKPERTGPVLKKEKPWEARSVDLLTVMQDEGKYRAWGRCAPTDNEMPWRKQFACYFESEDGINWTRPNLGLIEWNGSRENNLLFTEYNGILNGAVFKDENPNCPPEEKYKVMYLREITDEQFKEQVSKRPESWNGLKMPNYMMAQYYMSSPDGIHWTDHTEPVMTIFSDYYYQSFWHPGFKKYITYIRHWHALPRSEKVPTDPDRWDYWLPVGNRTIGYAVADDYGEFTPTDRIILWPGPEFAPTDGLYYAVFSRVPQAPQNYMMFPIVRHLRSDTTSIAMASSFDGLHWAWVPGSPVFETPSYGEWDGGCIWTIQGLIELPDGDFALPYYGNNVPHKYPRGNQTQATGYLIWDKGRLAAIEAKEKGYFATVAIVPPGNKLFLNCRTLRTGSIKVAAQIGERSAKMIEGHDFEHAIPVIGDHRRVRVKWNNAEDLGIDKNEPVILCFQLEQAEIFGIEFE